LSSWTSIVEIISAIAVVVTLLFLILEVRANTAVTRASLYASTLDALNEMQSVVIQDPDLTRVFYDFLQNEAADFDEMDRRRLQGLVVIMFRNYEKAYFMNEYDLLGEDEWSRYRRVVCQNYERAGSAGIADVLPFVLTERFIDYLAASCAR
jgi:hypothetical protein